MGGIETIKKEYESVKNVILSYTPPLGEIGAILRRNIKGCQVYYDGFNHASFRTQHLLLSAANYRRKWELTKYVRFLKDGVEYKCEYAKLEELYPNLENIDVLLSKREVEEAKPQSEKESTEYSIYLERNKTRSFLSRVVGFENAKKIAYDYAIKDIEDTPIDLRRYCPSKPLEDSDRFCSKWAYLTYECNGHYIYVSVE